MIRSLMLDTEAKVKGKANKVSRSGKVRGDAQANSQDEIFPLAERVIELIESARQKVVVAANLAQVYTNFEIGRQIVMEEQGGKTRAEYGEEIINELSARLTERYGRGWSPRNLRTIRQFFLLYSHKGIWQTLTAKSSDSGDLANTVCQIEEGTKESMLKSANGVCAIPSFIVSWSHYLLLMRVRDPLARAWYEQEARDRQWSVRQLDHHIASSTFERIEISKDKKKALALMDRQAPQLEAAIGDALKDTNVLEFLGLPKKYDEDLLEDRIFHHLEDFMMELGKGFTFAGRQYPCKVGKKTYHCDLAFYNRFTRSFFLIDLKLDAIGHDELGQMQMYVHYFDREVKTEDENPTIGILLSSKEVDRALVEMTLPKCEHNRIFVKQYSQVMPSKEALQRIVMEERRQYEQERLLARSASVGEGKHPSKSISKSQSKMKVKAR